MAGSVFHRVSVAGALLSLLPISAWAAPSPAEGFRSVPMPPGVRVQATELDGPVFANAKGMTLYRWPLGQLRNGPTGDPIGKSECTDVRTEVSAGLMSPYPGGLRLPDLEQRPSCADLWPPFRASARSRPVGDWTVIKRPDGSLQWAYEGFPVYTSVLDERPGDVFGGRPEKRRGDFPIMREPVKPPPDVPPGFAVATMSAGRLLTTANGYSVYSSDADAPGKSNCDAACAETWIPVLAPALAQAQGDWSLVERSAGIRQWAFRGKPLYTYRLDGDTQKQKGSDVPGWHNVFLQRAPAPPAGFTVQDTTAGQVLADAQGRTIYTYFCSDDALDQLGCDHPTQTQAYRLAICGGGDAERCLRTFPYVPAAKDAKSSSRSWSVITIDPMTGRLADPKQPGAMRVWAFRGRPVYTFAGDRAPGDAFGDGHGEFRGQRNGFKAFWLRDDFFGADQPGPG
jgi:predicted lipoprotein with Yx(FWY)xxD motif